jgi:hypothetical protein
MSPRIVLACATALLLCRGDIGSAQSQIGTADIPAFLPLSARPLVADRALSANDQNATRHFALLGEAEGLEQIRTLLVTSTVEEQWAYLPDQQVWIEIGVGETGSQVETDVEYLRQLLAFSNRIHLYHFHPAQYFEPGMNATLALALPSPTDVESSVKIARMQQALNPQGDVRNYVVSLYGVVEYEPTPLGRARLHAEATHPRASIERDLLTLVAVRRSGFNVARTLESATVAGPLDLIAELCSQLSSELYRMHFFQAR